MPISLAVAALFLSHGGPAPSAFATEASPASFTTLEHELGGHVGAAIAPLAGGPTTTLGDTQTAVAWSTSKVPVLIARLRYLVARHETLSAQDRSWAQQAIEISSNAAIEAIFTELEHAYGGLVPASLAVQHVLRLGGDAHTVINTAPNADGYTTYGQTPWSNANEVTVYRALANGQLLRPAGTAFVLGLMEHVVSDERFGVGSAGYPSGTRLAFKGGWGPDPQGDYTVRQTAIVGSGAGGYVVSMIAIPTSGTFADGEDDLTRLASWIRRHVKVAPGLGGAGDQLQIR